MCEFCEKGKALANGKTDYLVIAIQYPRKLIAYGYDVHGMGNNGIFVKINYCPMCGRELCHSDNAEWPRMSFYWLSEEMYWRKEKMS